MVCNAAVVGERITGNPMDTAIWDYTIAKGLQHAVDSYRSVDEVPFDYQRRMMSKVIQNNGQLILITKGAPESVLPKCDYVSESTAGIEPIDHVRKVLEGRLAENSKAGYRTLAVAYRSVEAKTGYSVEDEKSLTLLGFLVFTDPPRATHVKPSIAFELSELM